MKLINKILPIVALIGGSVSASMITTSCSKKEEVIEMHDLLKTYNPSTTPLSGGAYNQSEATKLYINSAKKNPQIFVDDLVLYLQDELNNSGIPKSDIISYKFGTNTPKFGKTIIWELGSDDIEYPTISSKQKYQFSMVNNLNSGDYQDVLSIDLQISYSNVVFYAYENVAGYWSLGLVDYSIGSSAFWPFISNINPWSINYSCSTSITRYYIDEHNKKSELWSRCSYYTGAIDSGDELINLWETYSNIPDDPSHFFEKQVTGILLIDYPSRYLHNVINIPEIRINGGLTAAEYQSQPSEGGQPNYFVVFSGPVFIRPVNLPLEDAKKYHIRVDGSVRFNAPKTEGGFINGISLDNTSNTTFMIDQDVTEGYRLDTKIKARLSWPYNDETVARDVVFHSEDTYFYANIWADGTEESDPTTIHQKVYLNCNSFVLKILPVPLLSKN